MEFFEMKFDEAFLARRAKGFNHKTRNTCGPFHISDGCDPNSCLLGDDAQLGIEPCPLEIDSI